MSLEALYSRLAAGTAKYRPKPDTSSLLAALTDWTTTNDLLTRYHLSRTAIYKRLIRLWTAGIIERRRQGNGTIPCEWRLIRKEKIWVK